jgi:hypothetical protein
MRRMNQLTEILDAFSAGSTVEYLKTVPDCPAGPWSLKVILAGPSTLTVNATAQNSSFLVTFTAAATAGLCAGVYQYVERVTDGTIVKDVERGIVTVTPNLETAGDGDLQSWDEKTLAVIEAKLQGRLGAGIDEYVIGSRQVKYIPSLELMKLRDKLVARIEAKKTPGQAGRSVEVRFRPTTATPTRFDR